MHWEAGRLSEVTVLFADCRGFTHLMHEKGPQAVKPMVDEFFKTCRKVVIKHDGIIDHFLGDAVLAFFNVPIKREDHVVTAVRAACEIQNAMPEVNSALGEEGLLKVGIGVSTGLAFTGVVGSNSCNDYTALGDSVNIASRLQGQAAPGEVLVTEDVYIVVRDEFPKAEERVLTLKGIDEPVKAHSISISDWKGSLGVGKAGQCMSS